MIYSTEKMIEVENLSKAFGDHKVLDGLNMKVNRGEVVSLIGFSGCGKSTLLKIVAGLEKEDAGSVKLYSHKMGMVFQYSALFDSMTVLENVSFPLREVLKEGLISLAEVRELVIDRLKIVGLVNVEDLYPSELSGGMRKRVAFARAIINDPEIILYDEPTAGLDPVSCTIIEDLILDLQAKTNAASIVVTHQESTIRRTSDHVCLLYNTKIVWEGPAAKLFDPANKDPYALQFREGNRQGPMLAAH